MAGAGRIRGITIEIGGNTTKLVSALKDVDKQIKNTQNSLKDVNKLLKMDPGNTELLRQKQQLLGDAVKQTSDRLEQLKNAQNGVAKGSDEWDALQREIIETEQNLDGLKKELKDFGSVASQKLKVVGEKFQEVGGKIQAAGQKLSKLSAVAAGALGGIAKLGYNAVVAADDLNTLSKQTGVSTDELQKWSYAADLVDVNVDTITGAMRKMKKNLDSNSGAFESLGVETRYSSGRLKDSTEIFYDTIEALSHIQDETERDIAAMDIFGKSADELAGIIDDGGAALRAYGEEAESLGLIISGDTLDQLNEANDTIDKLKATMTGSFAQAGATIAQTFAPALEKVAAVVGQVAEKIRGLTPEQAEMIVKILAIVAVVGPLVMIIGQIVSLIGTVITAVSALSGVMTVLLSPVGLVIAAIAALTAAFVYFYNTNEDFRNTVNEIVAFIMPLLQRAFEFIKQSFLNVVETIKIAVLTIKFLIEGFKIVIEGLRTAISKACTNIKNTFIALKNSIVETFTNLISRFRTWGSDMINNLVQGIKDKFNAVKDTISGVADVIRSYLHFSEPDVGPLSDFHTYAPDMMKLFADGIKNNSDLITSAIGSSFDLRPYFTSMNAGINRLTNVASNSMNASASQTGPVVVNISLEGDAQRLFRVLSEEAHRDWQVTGQSRLMGY